MSRIEDLIKQYAPDGVDHVLLSDVATTVSGLTGKAKADFTDGNARFVSYKNAFANLAVDQSADDFVNVAEGERQHVLRRGDVVFTGSSESVLEVGMSSVVMTEPTEPLYLNSFCFALRFVQDDFFEPGFSKYLFRSDGIRRQIQKAASGVTRINISKARFMNIRVPVPPLEVQREIVRMLDTFTDLEAELEADLEARRQQYAHYRDFLLSFTEREGVRWVPMGELGTFMRGRRFTKSDMVVEGIPSIHYGEIYTHYGVSASEANSCVREEIRETLRFARPGDVVIASVGETVEDVAKSVAWLGETEVAIHDDSFAFRSDADPTYIAYVMQTADFQAQKEKHVARGKVKRVGSANLGKIVVPVPSIEEQRRIVVILNSFDALANDLSFGLPAEIAARRNQYTYYRDRLLSFEEASS